jgi:hypothetical protein
MARLPGVNAPVGQCPVCGRPTYYKSSAEWRPYCSEACTVKATTPGKSKDALQPIPELSDFAPAAEPRCGKDVKPLTVAALLGLLLTWYEATKPAEPESKNYDLNTYRPKPRRW